MKTKILYEQDNMDYFVANLRDGTINAKGNWEFELDEDGKGWILEFDSRRVKYSVRAMLEGWTNPRFISKPDDTDLSTVLELKEWCKENLTGTWHMNASAYPLLGYVMIYLEEDTDLMLLRMRF